MKMNEQDKIELSKRAAEVCGVPYAKNLNVGQISAAMLPTCLYQDRALCFELAVNHGLQIRQIPYLAYVRVTPFDTKDDYDEDYSDFLGDKVEATCVAILKALADKSNWKLLSR